MTTKTDFLLEAFKFIEKMPESFVRLDLEQPSSSGRDPLVRVVRLLEFLQTWAESQGRFTYELYFTSRFTPALIQTKSMVEYAAVAYAVMEQLWQAKGRSSPASLEEGITTLLRGTRGFNQGSPGSEIPLLFLRVNLKFTGFQHDYDQLCRVVDPLSEVWAVDGQGLSGESLDGAASVIGLKNFVNGLVVFTHCFTQCGLSLPALLRLRALQRKS